MERLKDCLHNPTLITHNLLSSLHKQSQQLERALHFSTKSLSNQGISPREREGGVRLVSGCDSHLGTGWVAMCSITSVIMSLRM